MGRITSGMIGGGRLALCARWLVAAALLGSVAGCSDEACFSWTKQEGSCPAQEEALPFFVPPGCVGGIESVDSEPEFIVEPDDQIPGDLCCYSVTKSNNQYGFCEGGF
jgi:hypothetical protein